MAALQANIVQTGRRTVRIEARFQGDDPTYRGQRRLRTEFYDRNGMTSFVEILSQETAGAINTFQDTAEFAEDGLTLAWRAIIQYWDADGWHDTAFQKAGLLMMPQVITWLYADGEWKPAASRVFYNGEWR